MVEWCLKELILDLRPQNFVTFEPKEMNIVPCRWKSRWAIHEATKGNLHEDPNGLGVMDASRPVDDGETIDITKMKVTITDFGKGISFNG